MIRRFFLFFFSFFDFVADASAKKSATRTAAVPCVVHTNGVTDAVPADLRAGCFEVRYLSLMELTALALSCLSRFWLATHESSAVARLRGKTGDGDERVPDLDAFNGAADAADATGSEWQAAAQRQWEQSRRRLHNISTVRAPFDDCANVRREVESLYNGKVRFSDSRVRAFMVDVMCDSERAARDHALQRDCASAAAPAADRSHADPRQWRGRHYSEALQFRAHYVHMRTCANWPDGSALCAVPAHLFAPQFDTHATAGQPFVLNSVAQWRALLAQRLACALRAFDAPIDTEQQLLKFFGGRPRWRAFCKALDKRQATLDAVPNYRAVASALLQSVHLFLDDVERRVREHASLDDLFAPEFLHWADERRAPDLCTHAKLLAYLRGYREGARQSDYNEFDYDSARPHHERYGALMYEPSAAAALFYGTYFRRAASAASQFTAATAAAHRTDQDNPKQQQASAVAAELDAHCSDFAPWLPLMPADVSDDGDAAARWRQFARTLSQHSLRADALQDSLLWRDNESGAVDAQEERTRTGSILTLAFEPIDSVDSNFFNDYAKLYAPSARNRRDNPFYNFFSTVLEYTLASEEQYRRTVGERCPQAAEFVNRYVLRAYRRRHRAYYCAWLRRSVGTRAEPLLFNAVHVLADKSNCFWNEQMQRALLLDSRHAGQAMDTAWDSVLQFVLRAAPFNRELAANGQLKGEVVPFSTLYDYGVHVSRIIDACVARFAQQQQASIEQPPAEPAQSRAAPKTQPTRPLQRRGNKSAAATTSGAKQRTDSTPTKEPAALCNHDIAIVRGNRPMTRSVSRRCNFQARDVPVATVALRKRQRTVPQRHGLRTKRDASAQCLSHAELFQHSRMAQSTFEAAVFSQVDDAPADAPHLLTLAAAPARATRALKTTRASRAAASKTESKQPAVSKTRVRTIRALNTMY